MLVFRFVEGVRIRDTAGAAYRRSLVFSPHSFPRTLFAACRHFPLEIVSVATCVATFRWTIYNAGGGI